LPTCSKKHKTPPRSIPELTAIATATIDELSSLAGACFDHALLRTAAKRASAAKEHHRARLAAVRADRREVRRRRLAAERAHESRAAAARDVGAASAFADDVTALAAGFAGARPGPPAGAVGNAAGLLAAAAGIRGSTAAARNFATRLAQCAAARD
jgi:hypothetical protein